MQPARRGMIALSVVVLVAQVVDLVWPRADTRDGSPAGLVFVLALAALLAIYPTGRPVPRWIVLPAVATAGLWLAAYLVGPDGTASWLWPLPIAVPLLILVFGGQGYRYLRRSSPAEREAVRWPLLGVLLLLTLVVPPDLVSVALTGMPITDPHPVLASALRLAFLLPAAGFLVGVLAPPSELVDRLLAIWLSVVTGAVALGALFAATLLVAGLVVAQPWPAVVGAGAVAVAGVWVVPFARWVGRRVVFRGRADARDAVAALVRRLGATLDASEIPLHVVDGVRAALGTSGVLLRRSGRPDTWAVAGVPGVVDAPSALRTEVRYLGLVVGDLVTWPRLGESELAGADIRLIAEMADAAAPALHGARLANAFPELTERERQVLAGITRGLPNAAIAARLGVSGKTVANLVSIVLTKLRVPDRERAAELARRRAAESL